MEWFHLLSLREKPHVFPQRKSSQQIITGADGGLALNRKQKIMNTALPTPNLTSFVQSPARREPSGRFAFVALLGGLFLLLSGMFAAHAVQIPVGCTGSGLGINLFTSSPDVHIGDTLAYDITVFNGIVNSGGRVVCDAEAIQAFVVTPDGVSHPITLVRTYRVKIVQ